MKKTAAQIRIEILEANKELKNLVEETRNPASKVKMRWIRIRELEWRIKAMQAKL